MTQPTLLIRQQREAGLLVSVAPPQGGMTRIHFQAYRLKPGETLTGDEAGREAALVVLGGKCTVAAGSLEFRGVGTRRDVWEKVPPAVLLLPPATPFSVRAETDLHLAVASAPVSRGGVRAVRLVGPEEMVTEHRGEGQTYRYIQHLLPPASTLAESLILVEVYTPGGNWSSFPPHKHDTEDPPHESFLEEIYYYQIRPSGGFAFQLVYTDDRALDVACAPGDGDLVLVPRGYHPVAATPGHDAYYLNVMAGPTRNWNFRPDPVYAHLMNWQKPNV